MSIESSDGWTVTNDPPRWMKVKDLPVAPKPPSRLRTWLQEPLTPESKNAWKLAVLMFVNYALNAISFRMIQRVSYVGVALSDALIAWWGFTMIQHINKAETKKEQIGYTIGGILGSVLGLYLTTLWS
jgi:hypothetical protein